MLMAKGMSCLNALKEAVHHLKLAFDIIRRVLIVQQTVLGSGEPISPSSRV